MKIIKHKKLGLFEFAGYDSKLDSHCDICGFPLNYGYTQLISKLREDNLLPQDFQKLCCGCYFWKYEAQIIHIQIKYNRQEAYLTYTDNSLEQISSTCSLEKVRTIAREKIKEFLENRLDNKEYYHIYSYLKKRWWK